MIKRSPIRKVRSKPRRGQPTKAEKASVRLAVYERAEGRCELHLLPNCIRGVLPYGGGTVWDHGHLVHLKSRGAGGSWSLDNCKWGCYICHLVGLHNPKSVPPKPID
jgi:hypothetical protein